MTRTRKRRTLTAVALAASGFACTEGLEQYFEVTDLRVLAIRADPPDILDTPLPSTVRFQALVYDPSDPRGTEINYQWQFCPVQSGRACRDYDEKLEQAIGNANQTLGAMGIAPIGGAGAAGSGGTAGTGGTGPIGLGACQLSPEVRAGVAGLATPFADIDGSTYLTDRYRDLHFGETFTLTTGQQGGLLPVPLGFLPALVTLLRACDPNALPADLDLDLLPSASSDLHLFHLLSNPLESMLGVWPSAVLTVRSGTQELVAMKRVTLQLARPAALLELMRVLLPTSDFGINLCAPDASLSSAPATSDCLRVRDRTANRNPVFFDVQVAQGESATGAFQTIQSAPASGAPLQLDRISLATEESIRILPILTEDSVEAYQTINVNISTQAIEVRDTHEEISISWFVTHGKLGEQLTWRKLTKSLDTVYTAPETVPDEPVRLWMVARDQRGGTAWEELVIEIVE